MRSIRLHGGSTALLYNDHLSIKRNSSGEHQSFEFSDCTFHERDMRLRVVIIYRPPNSEYHPVSITTFLTEFSSFLESIVICSEPLIITGDFNIHVDDESDSRDFLDLLQSMSLEQHVHQPTHEKGHTLDLTITRSPDSMISSIAAADELFFDHFFPFQNHTYPPR